MKKCEQLGRLACNRHGDLLQSTVHEDAFATLYLESWTLEKVVQQETPYIGISIPFAFFAFLARPVIRIQQIQHTDFK